MILKMLVIFSKKYSMPINTSVLNTLINLSKQEDIKEVKKAIG